MINITVKLKNSILIIAQKSKMNIDEYISNYSLWFSFSADRYIINKIVTKFTKSNLSIYFTTKLYIQKELF